MGFQTKRRTIRTSPLHLLQRSCCLFFSGDVLTGFLQAVTSWTVIFFSFTKWRPNVSRQPVWQKKHLPVSLFLGSPFFPCLLFSTSSFHFFCSSGTTPFSFYVIYLFIFFCFLSLTLPYSCSTLFFLLDKPFDARGTWRVGYTYGTDG